MAVQLSRESLRESPRIIAIAGGKGGVGKSTLAANLALAIGRMGHRVTIVDADLGAANLHTMLGVLRPASGLADFLDHRADSLDEVLTQVPSSTVSLVAGSSRPGAANLSHAQNVRLIRAIAKLDSDVVIIDIGAGTSYTVVDLVAAADLKLFVVTPQLPSLHNVYALMKACVHRIIRRLSEDETQQSLIDSALGNETKARTITQLLTVLRPLDPALADRIVDTLTRFGAGLVGNQIESVGDAGVLDRIGAMIYEHLLVHAPSQAIIKRSPALSGGLKAGARTLLSRGDEGYSAFRVLATTLLDADLDKLRGTTRSAMHRTMPMWLPHDLDAAMPAK
jgi:flagellar biosynthesis protein FlhG